MQTIDRLTEFRDRWATAFAETRGLAAQLRAIEHRLAADSRCQQFLGEYETARSDARLAEPEVWRPIQAGGRPSPQARPALSSVRPFPSPDGAPIHTEAVRHHMNRDVTLKQFDGTESSLLELSRAPLWAHGVPPTGNHSVLGHYLHSNH